MTISRLNSSRLSPRSSFHQPNLPTNLLERLHREVEILSRVRGTHLAANARMALRDHRIPEACHEDSLLEHHVADLDREGGLTDDDRHDRGVAFERLEPRFGDRRAKVAGVV